MVVDAYASRVNATSDEQDHQTEGSHDGEDDGDAPSRGWHYGEALYKDDGTTLDDLRKAVTTLEDTTRIARRVLDGTHPLTTGIANSLRDARAALAARETPPPSSPSESV